MVKRKKNNKITLSFEIDERGKKGGGLPSPIGKSRASSSKKVERNKRGSQSPSPTQASLEFQALR
jgi:hypothetical protein